MYEPALTIKNKTHVNLAGIVPVAGQPLDFNFPWHDSLMPIGHNYLAVEKAVFDCVVAITSGSSTGSASGSAVGAPRTVVV